MKLQRITLALAALAACGAVSAQYASVSQSGNADTATIDQYTPAGGVTSAVINQGGGSVNNATIRQGLSGPVGPNGLSATASVSQQGTQGASATVSQHSVAGSSVQLVQSMGAGSTADLLQLNVTNSRMIVDQIASGQRALVQQTQGSDGAYVRTGQGIGANNLTILQGQPAGGVFNSQARTIQNGDGNDSFTLQASGSNLAAYTAQGINSMPGYYYSNAVGGYVEVDRNVPMVYTYDSTASIYQTSGSNNGAYILQYGSSLTGTVMQSGANNFAGVLQTGVGNHSYVSQSGYGNTATLAQRGNGSNANVFQSGGGNTATVTQR